MNVTRQIRSAVVKALQHLYQQSFTEKDFQVNQTKPEFEGDYTVVLFSLVKQLKKSPDALGNELGQQLISGNSALFASYNLIKGFLNLVINDAYWKMFLEEQAGLPTGKAGLPTGKAGLPAGEAGNARFGLQEPTGQKVMVEYSSPNTNKPLHLGHLRNNFLGWSVAAIYKANGAEVVKTCIVNDRGIHICKSMIAWQLFANGATPESAATKGDHFVGDYYVKFNDAYKKQVQELVGSGMKEEEAEKEAPIMKAAQQMLIDWEAGDEKVIGLWKKMNQWVYQGFDETYKRIGSDFHKIYYESETYLLGKQYVEQGLAKGIFFKKDDGSVWVDLSNEGLDQKLLQRRDGTSVYITQDLGLADVKQSEFHASQSIYVIGDEQNYHMQVLKLICKKLGIPNADGIYHLSYGMVELPTGKMKSREGTVVDADELLDEMYAIASQHTEELGKVQDFSEDELKELCNTISLGALKFFLLRVDPKKRMIFNPEESIDFHGFTGPFVQYTYARIRSILRKAQAQQEPGTASPANINAPLLRLEKELILLLEQFPATVEQAGQEMNPSVLAVYVFNLAKTFNSFYAEHSIMSAETAEKKTLRLQIAQLTAHVIKTGMGLLGINVPERM
ncbi:MAG TPA: arginine--tRNA ligase [Chitinophagaceae bacterium]|nr:arginine--tRNA ligase [Chitinophagaceae bacterium]